jgi:phosphatidylglycerol lysyltransferase
MAILSYPKFENYNQSFPVLSAGKLNYSGKSILIICFMQSGIFKKKGTGLRKFYWREILACLFLMIGIYFLRKQIHQLHTIIPYLQHADQAWLFLAFVVTVLFIGLQSAMYVNSFNAISLKLKWKYAAELFLKRNILAVFLPGGGVSALAFTSINVKRTIKDKVKINQASGLFAFAGMVSTFIVGIPVLFLNTNKEINGSLTGLLLITAAILLVFIVFKAIKSKGKFYRFLENKFPAFARETSLLTDASINTKHLNLSILSSVGVELCGILHLYVAMLAIGAPASLQAAGSAYIISLLLMVASPFLKGLGAVELSIVYVLVQFGYNPVQALSITIIYRFFEFWLPMLSGLFSFLMKGKSLFLRLFPAVSIFILGIVNILSVVTPPLAERMQFIRNMLPVTTIHATNMLVLFTGLMLLVTSAFLLKGMRNAWWMAVVITFLSIPGHLLKAFDYEEAIVAAIVFAILLATRKQYKLKTYTKQVYTGVTVTLISFGAVLIYGFIGFYFLEKRHFGIDFDWKTSFVYSIESFFLMNTDGLHPLTRFGKEFLYSLNAMGLLCWAFLLYSLIRPYLHSQPGSENTIQKAKELLKKYGHSAVDYFTIAEDKTIFISNEYEGFVSYRIARHFAIVLNEPVCAPENKIPVLKEFSRYCHKRGLKTAYYRVDETGLGYFTGLKTKKLVIGQEALLDVAAFDLAGRSKKALRNSLNSLEKKGFVTELFTPPHSDEFIKQLQIVSDEWLRNYKRTEMVFAQGKFDPEELKEQHIVATKDMNGDVVAFLNIIPNYAPDECTYDLIRKKMLAPGGCMDALIIELIKYAKEKNYSFLNLGMVPFSGISQPDNTAEQILQFAYNKVGRFRQYKGLREFKEKYASAWQNKYLVYEDDFDLLQLPRALNKVMQPQSLSSV